LYSWTEHGDARFATASLSDQNADALQKREVTAWLTHHAAAARFSPAECVGGAGLIAHERFCGHCADR